MKLWQGAAGLCVNNENKILMVLQGRPDEEKTWSIPSGQKNQNETFEECCAREMFEETGYQVEVMEEFFVKKGENSEWIFEVRYFYTKWIGGERKFQDPDQLIYDIAWKSADEIENLELTYPEDRDLLNRIVTNKGIK
ncbi:ADP-ribose pyrophosphatase YjhB (NUDIX family) [Bacillus oleivorans]|uniref:ADP-ribose pyrophosphatase YjhB (NUDIX family) n=1 Tax=Bacillus oleivorans TaxID=1448271 RepID=A0A285D4U6_9BACI|nr:NUDIX hydrolase [Bacillus oleivorans]SNX74820.1 ADP-ribose pyrophosphatase YjhB (NUDIX family) [Bacillus oleivorans]